MALSAYDFIFFSDDALAPKGWHETLRALSSQKDLNESRQLLCHLVSFASEFSLSGNIWQYWLTYVLMMHENAFTLSCERKSINKQSTLFRMAEADFQVFQNLMSFDLTGFGQLSVMTDYTAPFEDETPNRAGAAIIRLCESIISANNISEFSDRLIRYYENFGIGIFGLYKAFRISGNERDFVLIPVKDDTDVCFDDLIGLETQKRTLQKNTEAFLEGLPANNVLLYGDSGTGKSTSIHALMHDYFDRGLRLIELSKQDRKLLPQVLASAKKRNYRFIVFLDDLSFEENESDYKELKAMLEGALEKRSDRVLIYATSNRRHLIRETWTDRNDMEYQNDIHHSDTMEEKLSLASRFGVTIFYGKPNQKEYLNIVKALAEKNHLDFEDKEISDQARKWELRHGGMSGRTASQLITWLRGESDNKVY